MSALDTWTDETVERALRLLRVGESIVAWYRHPSSGQGIRPVTVDRWLTDVAEFNLEQWRHLENAEAEDDGQGEAGAVDDRRPKRNGHVCGSRA